MPYKVNPITGNLDYYEAPGSAGNGANLTFVPGVTTGVVVSDSGTDASIPLADGTNSGLFSATEKAKLAAIAAGAEVNVNADWNATSGDAQILNKPTSLPTDNIKHAVKYAEALTKGQAVYVSSADGTNMIVSKADNSSESTSSKTLGLVTSTGAANYQGEVITEGLLVGLDTSTATIGDAVWLGTNGNLIFWHYGGSTTKPVAPAHLVFIGVVTRVNANNGEIFVKVQNGYELDELHDVSLPSYINKGVLYRDTADNLWKHAKISSLLTLTTTGTGAATLIDDTLNIPIPSAGTSEKAGSIFNTTRSIPFRMSTNITTYRSASGMTTTTTSSSTFAGETTTFYPISLKEGSDIRAIACRVYTAGSAGLGTAHVEFGIYNSTTDGDGNLIPNTLEVQFGKVSILTTGVKEAVLSTPYTLGATTDNIYWIAFRNYSTNSATLNTYSTGDVVSTFMGISSSTALVKLGSFIATTPYTNPDGLPASLPATGGVGFTQSATVAGYTTYQALVGIR